jgi:opacity protein-like surface antigen
MRVWLAVVVVFGGGVFGGGAPALRAQERPARIELYGGYDRVQYNASPRISGHPLSESFSANGLSGQIEYNVNRRLGVVAEFSGYALARKGFDTTHQLSYLFGPRINLRYGRVKPFAQALFGGLWVEDGFTLGPFNAFGATMGGGIDIGMTRHIAIQAEYFLTRIADGNNNRQNNFRYGAGIVLTVGGK